jgi:hypothetical protein
MSRPTVRLLRVSRVPILQQLNLEEALLRATADNWMLVNDGNDSRAVVMGISGWAAQPGGPPATAVRQNPMRHPAPSPVLPPTAGSRTSCCMWRPCETSVCP